MLCYKCGLSCPADCRHCPSCGAKIAGPQPFLPLRGLGHVISALLAVVIAVVAARVIRQSWGFASWPRPGDVTVRGPDTFGNSTIVVTGILFVVWFRRARINAEWFMRQRRARGWAFWGWIIPIVNFWFPFQIMGDIWRAALPPRQRARTAWLPVIWWTSWLLAAFSYGHDLDAVHARPAAVPGPGPDLAVNTWPLSLVFLLLAGGALIAIIHRISAGPVGSPPQRQAPE